MGTSYYRTKDWKDAAEALEHAISLRNLSEVIDGAVIYSEAANNGFFLTMAFWQLGQKEKAREWFDKATQWMVKGKKGDSETKRFQAEAAELLGIQNQTD